MFRKNTQHGGMLIQPSRYRFVRNTVLIFIALLLTFVAGFVIYANMQKEAQAEPVQIVDVATGDEHSLAVSSSGVVYAK